MNMIDSAPDDVVSFWEKHGDVIKGDWYASDGNRSAHYSPLHRSVHMNVSDGRADGRALGFGRGELTFAHETGHAFDYNAYRQPLRFMKQLEDLDDLLKADYLAKANQILASKGMKGIKSLDRLSMDVKEVLSADLKKDAQLKASVSDIVGGLTKNRVVGNYYHKTNYWDNRSASTEAIAEMFEAWTIPKKNQDYMREYFLTAYQRFLDTIKYLEEGGTPE